jgi:hypothetical protein
MLPHQQRSDQIRVRKSPTNGNFWSLGQPDHTPSLYLDYFVQNARRKPLARLKEVPQCMDQRGMDEVACRYLSDRARSLKYRLQQV